MAELAAKLKWYEEQFRLAQHKRFGASSEKTHPDQIGARICSMKRKCCATPEGEEPTTETVTYSRKKPAAAKPSWIIACRDDHV